MLPFFIWSRIFFEKWWRWRHGRMGLSPNWSNWILWIVEDVFQALTVQQLHYFLCWRRGKVFQKNFRQVLFIKILQLVRNFKLYSTAETFDFTAIWWFSLNMKLSLYPRNKLLLLLSAKSLKRWRFSQNVFSGCS